jgi:hypothetical protein
MRAAMASDVCARALWLQDKRPTCSWVRRERAIDAMAPAVTVLESQGERTVAAAPGGC